MSAVWEYREMRFGRDADRSEVRAFLTSIAETDRWELDRVRVLRDGRRWVRVRRKTYHLPRSA